MIEVEAAADLDTAVCLLPLEGQLVDVMAPNMDGYKTDQAYNCSYDESMLSRSLAPVEAVAREDQTRGSPGEEDRHPGRVRKAGDESYSRVL